MEFEGGAEELWIEINWIQERDGVVKKEQIQIKKGEVYLGREFFQIKDKLLSRKQILLHSFRKQNDYNVFVTRVRTYESS